MNNKKYISLTTDQKLNALAFKYYQGAKWEPKTGDYYTTSRNDLELYQIVEANEKVVRTRYCDPQRGDAITDWPTERFLLDFGVNRVFVPDWILNTPKAEDETVQKYNASLIEQQREEYKKLYADYYDMRFKIRCPA